MRLKQLIKLHHQHALVSKQHVSQQPLSSQYDTQAAEQPAPSAGLGKEVHAGQQAGQPSIEGFSL